MSSTVCTHALVTVSRANYRDRIYEDRVGVRVDNFLHTTTELINENIQPISFGPVNEFLLVSSPVAFTLELTDSNDNIFTSVSKGLVIMYSAAILVRILPIVGQVEATIRIAYA